MRFILSIILAVSLLFTSCGKYGISTSAAIAAGVATGLRFVNPVEKRTVIADYINVYASGLRTISGNPTDQELMDLLNKFVPPDVLAQYPELVAFVTPLIIAAYRKAPKYETLSDIALGLESGSSGFITPKT